MKKLFILLLFLTISLVISCGDDKKSDSKLDSDITVIDNESLDEVVDISETNSDEDVEIKKDEDVVIGKDDEVVVQKDEDAMIEKDEDAIVEKDEDVIVDSDSVTAYVNIVSPADGGEPENPVTFKIEATAVSTVEIKADDFSLGDPWNPSDTTELTYDFSGTGFDRNIVLYGYDSDNAVVAQHSITIKVVEPVSLDKGEYIGEMWNTYYYFSNENDFSGTDDTTLYDSSCNPIAEVPASFSDSVCIEGSGILEDGTVINYSSKCSCGRACPTGGTVCYIELDPVDFPWGMGSKSNPLVPLVSFAVDTSFIPFGTTLYVEEFDGQLIPLVDGIGGFEHDGCFRADDVGGAIKDDHFDFFSGTTNMWKSLETIFATGSTFNVYKNGDRCSHLK